MPTVLLSSPLVFSAIFATALLLSVGLRVWLATRQVRHVARHPGAVVVRQAQPHLGCREPLFRRPPIPAQRSLLVARRAQPTLEDVFLAATRRSWDAKLAPVATPAGPAT